MEKYLCDECKGLEEVVYVTEIETNKPMAMITCPKCGGVGYLDWVEKVVGKHEVSQKVRWFIKDELIFKEVMKHGRFERRSIKTNERKI